MAEFTRVVDLVDAVEAFQLNQYAATLEGDVGAGRPITLTALNDSVAYALRVANQDTVNSRAFKVFKANLTDAWIDVTKTGTRVDGLQLVHQAGTPDAPGSGLMALYPKTDDGLYFRSGSGSEIELADTSTAQTFTNKTLTSPTITSPTITSPTITGLSLSDALTLPQILTPSAPVSGTSIYSKAGGGLYTRAASGSEVQYVDTSSTQTVGGAKTFSSPVLLPDGSVGAPSWGFSSDSDNGSRYISTNKWSHVVGGADYMRFRSGSVLPEIKIGNVDFLTATTNERAIPLHIQVQTTDPNDLIIGLHTEVTNNATASVTPAGTPDSSAITCVFYQSEATTVGAFRALEVHGTRSRPAAGAGINDSAMACEMGIHTAAAGNASFGTGTAVPKTMGMWLSSYADALMVTQGETAVAADVGLYITGPLGGGGGGGGFRYPIFYHDTSNNIDFYINDQGHVRASTDNNQAAVGYGFVGENGLGMFWGGANNLAWAAGGTERMRLDTNGLGINRVPSASTSLAVQGPCLFVSGAAGTSQFFQLGRTGVDGQFVIAGSAAQYANEATAGDFVLRAETGNDMLLANGADGVSVIRLGASSLGLFGTAPTSKKTVTGSRAGNAAVASLLTQLAAYGLITDGTSA